MHIIHNSTLIAYKVDDPDKAITFIEKYDALVATARPTCRISDIFCGRQSSSLRHDFENWAYHRIMSTRLRTTITSYQCCMLDDSFQESPHGIITALAKRATNSGPSWWSANFRFKQSMDIKRVLDSHCSSRFSDLFRHWRLLFSRRPTGKQLKHPRKFIRKDFIKKVYRCDEYAFHNLNIVKKVQEKFLALSSEEIHPLQHNAKMVQEYYNIVLTDNSMFSFIDTVTTSNAALTGVNGPMQELQLPKPPETFQLVSSDFNNKKTIRTADVRADLALKAPVMVNKFDFWNYNGDHSSQNFVFAHGLPVVVDVMAAPNSSAMVRRMKSLVQWSVERNSDVKGTVCIHSPVPVISRPWIS